MSGIIGNGLDLFGTDMKGKIPSVHFLYEPIINSNGGIISGWSRDGGLFRTISGTVTNALTPVSRDVVAINRESLLPICRVHADASDGQYKLILPQGVPFILVCLDDDAGTFQNDRVLRVSP